MNPFKDPEVGLRIRLLAWALPPGLMFVEWSIQGEWLWLAGTVAYVIGTIIVLAFLAKRKDKE